MDRCPPPGADLDPRDRAVLDAFRDFLRDPLSRCPMCLADDHTRLSQCPEVPDTQRHALGVIAMDVAQARQLARMAITGRLTRHPHPRPPIGARR